MKKTAIALALTLSALSSSANAAMILLTQFDHTGYTQMASTLEAMGHTVDIVDARAGGSIATALSATDYDQVFLWDLTAQLYLNSTDIDALATFWNPSMGMVVDTRSYGYHFQGSNASEMALLQNISTNLALSGGGMWIGTDHSPEWSRNANPVLDALGFSTITGSYSLPVNYADPTSVLLDNVTPTDLWAANQSVGSAPIGLQANGTEMFIHFGHTDANGGILPYISASFDLRGPSAVSAPATALLFAGGVCGLALRRRKNK